MTPPPRVVTLVDRVAALLVVPCAAFLRRLRRFGIHRLPRVRAALRRAGVYPLVDHYYEPLFRTDGLDPAAGPRSLPGIDLDVPGQLAFLDRLGDGSEFRRFVAEDGFAVDNPWFAAGDADFLHAVVRHLRPARVVEIGSGQSTRVVAAALRANLDDDPSHRCEHLCIEPYEAPWLESLGVTVLRQRVEQVPLRTFEALEAGDLLFIDSSHVVRPQGDVLHELLDVLPRLAVGVVVHVHDVFTPRDYPPDWLEERVRLWNEQYVLEAFLTHNAAWRVLAALNLLQHDHPDALARVCPFLTPEREPGSFYLVRR